MNPVLQSTEDSKETTYTDSFLKMQLLPIRSATNAFVDAIFVEVLGKSYYQVSIPLLSHEKADVEDSLSNASFQRGPC